MSEIEIEDADIMTSNAIGTDPDRAGSGFTLAGLCGDLGELTGDGAVRVDGLAIDSRVVRPGVLFVALRGLHTDGHRFIGDAIGRGAAAVLIEQLPGASSAPGVPFVRVVDTEPALAIVAARFFRHPSHTVPMLGVTGTNGKTTVTHLIASAYRASGVRAAVLGTLGAGIDGELTEIGYTTPTAERYQAMLRELVDAGAGVVAAEISSHALKTRRTFGTRFRVVGFTNLTRDHLDFHGDASDYLESKLQLFDREARGDATPVTAVVHLDDPAAVHFVTRARASGDRVVTVGGGQGADVGIADLELGPDGSRFVIRHPAGRSPIALRLPGAFNVQNALVAFAMATGAGLAPAVAAQGIEALERVPGRLERVDRGGPVRVLVDYAHTPDALETVLTTVRGITPRRLIVVFGCGGDRDRGKRPLMATAGVQLADVAVMTSDNPRSEDPAAILADMEQGVRGADNYEIVVDRRQAIRRAIEIAGQGDVVVIAGKGHEPVQIIGDRHLPFDDREEAARVLAESGRSDAPGTTPRRPAVRAPLTIASILHQLRDEEAATTAADGPLDVPVRGATLDSRAVQAGQLFVALAGERSHGAQFAGVALAAGAAGVLLGRDAVEQLPPDVDRRRVILVDDPVRAMTSLAAAHRRRLAPRLVAITGSAGKTTAKEMVADVLSTELAVHRTPGNYNNHLGLPITLLGLEPHHSAAVVELGMNAPGEIAALGRLCAPDLGVLTGVGRAHLAGLGSRAAIIDAKLELAEVLGRQGQLFLPGDDPELLAAARRRPAALTTVGREDHNTLRLIRMEPDPTGWRAELRGLGYDDRVVTLPVAAPGLMPNALLALAVAHDFGIAPAAAITALAAFRPLPHRMMLRTAGDVEIIDDCYNANPESMAVALEALRLRRARRRLAVLGDMRELGTHAAAAHRELGERAAPIVDHLYLIGEEAATVAAGAQAAGLSSSCITVIAEREELAARVVACLAPGDLVLVKASRALELEHVVTAIQSAAGEGDS